MQFSGFNNVYIVPTHEQEDTYRDILFVASSKPVKFENASLSLTVNGIQADWSKIPIKLTIKELTESIVLKDDTPEVRLYQST